jgi:hypothetical protein
MDEKDGKITLEQLFYIIMIANIIVSVCFMALKGGAR